MSRHRRYSSDAERQAAYRLRKSLPGIYGLAEQEAILNAAWELRDAVQAAAERGNSEAARLNGLAPSQLIRLIVERFRAHS